MGFEIARLGLPLALLAIGLALGAAALTLARRSLGKLPGSDAQDGPTPHELLTNFRELHARGGLSDEEFRTIKSKLAVELQTGLPGRSAEGTDPPADAAQAAPKG